MNMRQTILPALFTALSTFSYGQWTDICTTGNGFVVDFETWNGELFATGFFNTICGTSCNYVAKFDGTTWQPVGNGFEEAGHQLKVIGSDLYGVRYEQSLDSNWLYRFDGSDFQPVGEGVYLTTFAGLSQTANLYNLIEYNGEIVVCGEFDRVGNQNISGIIRRSGNQWQPLGAGLSGHIPSTPPVMYPHDMCIYNGDLVVAGNFLQAGGQTVNGIARWDGSQWHSFGAGFNRIVYGVAVYNGELYAGGDFTMSGSTPVGQIARWNGSEWESPGFSPFYENQWNYTYVHSLKVINDRLIVSGGFDRVIQGTETMECAAVIAFDGTNIDTLHGGLIGKEAEAIALYNGLLYVGGGLNGSSYVARYDDVTGIEEPSEIPLVIFPNPSSGTVNIQSEEGWDAIRISGSAGNTVTENRQPGISWKVDLAAGIYFITVWKDGQSFTQKVIVAGS